MNWAQWLLSMVGPIVARAVSALGFTAVMFTGVETLVQQLISTAQSNWAAMPVAVLQLATLGGITEALGLLFGASLSIFTMKAAVGAGRYVFKPK